MSSSDDKDLEIRRLKKLLVDKDEELEDLENSLSVTLESIKTFHSQQQQLFEEFVLLREKYDMQKIRMAEILWEYIPQNTTKSNFQKIPKVLEALDESNDTIRDYELGGVLGEGQFASVRACSKKGSSPKETLAVKIIDKEKIHSVIEVERVNNEILTLTSLSHVGLLSIYDVIHTKKYLYLFMEKGGTDLFEFCGGEDSLSEKKIQTFVKQIVSCVSHLHQHSVCHRDIKPENILVNDKDQIKIVDLGLSMKVTSVEPLQDFCGSPGFFAPELIMKDGYNGFAADAWSIGCVMMEMILGHDFFTNKWMAIYTYENMQNQIDFGREIDTAIAGVINELDARSDLSSECKHLLKSILCVDDSKRLKMEEICTHPWIDIKQKKVSPPKNTRLKLRRTNTNGYILPVPNASTQSSSVLEDLDARTDLSSECKHLLKGILCVDDSKRLKMTENSTHPCKQKFESPQKNSILQLKRTKLGTPPVPYVMAQSPTNADRVDFKPLRRSSSFNTALLPLDIDDILEEESYESIRSVTPNSASLNPLSARSINTADSEGWVSPGDAKDTGFQKILEFGPAAIIPSNDDSSGNLLQLNTKLPPISRLRSRICPGTPTITNARKLVTAGDKIIERHQINQM